MFNLTVEGAHLFFANGVLVHNCDSTTMAIRDLTNRVSMKIDPRVLKPQDSFMQRFGRGF